jgi:hypothetical protein
MVTLPRLEGQHEVHSEPVTFELWPAFHVLNTEIHLTTVSPQASIRVATLPKVAESIQVGTFNIYFILYLYLPPYTHPCSQDPLMTIFFDPNPIFL